MVIREVSSYKEVTEGIIFMCFICIYVYRKLWLRFWRSWQKWRYLYMCTCMWYTVHVLVQSSGWVGRVSVWNTIQLVFIWKWLSLGLCWVSCVALSLKSEVFVHMFLQHTNIVNFMDFWHDKVEHQDRVSYMYMCPDNVELSLYIVCCFNWNFTCRRYNIEGNFHGRKLCVVVLGSWVWKFSPWKA